MALLLQNYARVWLTTILIVFCLPGYTLQVNDSTQVEVLLNSRMLNQSDLKSKFINSMDITPKQLILLSTNHQFYLLGWGLINPICNTITGDISSFAYTSDNLLMVIRNKEICTFDSTQTLTKIIGLPRNGMAISAGKYVMYVYDRDVNQPVHSLYVVVQGGQYRKLFDSPAAFQSVAEMKNRIIFSTSNGLFSFNPRNKELKALATLPKENLIKSIAVDTISQRIYFSTNNAVYALMEAKTVPVTNDFGGTLRFFQGGLIIINPDKQLMIRIPGIENKISKSQETKTASTGKKNTDILTNAGIIQMAEAGLSDEFIVNLINKSDVNFKVNVDSLIELSNHNVSSIVISGMKTAMKRKTADDTKSRN